MKIILATAIVAIGLGFLLSWRSPILTKGAYRIALLVSVATFAAFLFFPTSNSSFVVHLGRNPFAAISAIALLLAPLIPFVLLVEAGIAGYRGFSSWVRYVPSVVALLGGAGLLASFLIPWVLRR